MVRRFWNRNKVGNACASHASNRRRTIVCATCRRTPSGKKRGEPHMTTCPIGSCNREMHRLPSRSDGGRDPVSGLHHFHCSHCRHTGMVPGGEVQLLFRAGNQYVVAYGPSLSTITVVLAARALTAYQAYALSSEELAKLVAGWALLSGPSQALSPSIRNGRSSLLRAV